MIMQESRVAPIRLAQKFSRVSEPPDHHAMRERAEHAERRRLGGGGPADDHHANHEDDQHQAGNEVALLSLILSRNVSVIHVAAASSPG